MLDPRVRGPPRCAAAESCAGCVFVRSDETAISVGQACSTMATKLWLFSQPSKTALFCPHCHSLLSLPDANQKLSCGSCSFSSPLQDFQKASKSFSQTHVFQHDVVPDKKGYQEGQQPKRATVKETCPQCGHNKMSFYTLQLRSVDEGQTVFYTCLKCEFSYSTNT